MPQAVAPVRRHPGGPALATYWLDRQLRYTRVTREAAAMVGLEPAAMIGLTPDDIVPDGCCAPILTAMREVLATRVPQVVQQPSGLHDGFDAWARVSPIHGGGVRVAVRLVAAADIQKFAGVVLPLIASSL